MRDFLIAFVLGIVMLTMGYTLGHISATMDCISDTITNVTKLVESPKKGPTQ